MSTLAHGCAALFFLLGVQLGRTSNSDRGDLVDRGVHLVAAVDVVEFIEVTEATLEGVELTD